MKCWARVLFCLRFLVVDLDSIIFHKILASLNLNTSVLTLFYVWICFITPRNYLLCQTFRVVFNVTTWQLKIFQDFYSNIHTKSLKIRLFRVIFYLIRQTYALCFFQIWLNEMKQSKEMKFKWQKHFMHMSKSKMSRVLSQDSKHWNKTLRYFLLVWHICTDNQLSKIVYYILVMSLLIICCMMRHFMIWNQLSDMNSKNRNKIR